MKTKTLKTLKFVLFLAPLFLYVFFTEHSLSKLPNSYTAKKRGIEQALPKLEVLNLGSSHGNFGIDPAPFHYPGFNLANVSQTLYYDDNLLKLYIKRAPKLRIVLIPISYFTLGERLIDTKEYWRGFFYERTYGIPMENHSRDYDIKRYSWYLLYGNSAVTGWLMKGFRMNPAADIHENGFCGERQFVVADYMKNIGEASAQKRVEGHNQEFDTANVAQNVGYLMDMIELCQASQIVPVIVTTPVYKSYARRMDMRLWGLTQEKIGGLVKKYGISYRDFLNDSRFVREDFRDNDHLNPDGAEKLSRILNDEVLTPIMIDSTVP